MFFGGGAPNGWSFDGGGAPTNVPAVPGKKDKANDGCPIVPTAPDDNDINSNIVEALKHRWERK